MKKNNTYLLLSIVGLLLIVGVSNTNNITGNLIIGDEETTKAYTLNDHALDFFRINEIIFPQGVCIPAAHELYGEVAYIPVDVSAGYSTSGQERTATRSFVVDRHERYGTIDFVKTPTFLAEKQADSLISISSEAIVRVPKAERTTYLAMDLYATTIGPYMYITKGRYSTPSTDCIFLVENGYAYCDCDIHTIKGIAIGGITSPPQSEERYKQLLNRTEQAIEKAGNIGSAIREDGILISKVNQIPWNR